MRHPQKWIKVNAPVDEGIAELIEALSLFPQLRTTSSCQGSDQHAASVFFVYGEDHIGAWQEAAEFILRFLGPRLYQHLGDRVELVVIPQVSAFFKCRLVIYPGAMKATICALCKISKEVNNEAAHTLQCSDDSPHTTPVDFGAPQATTD